MSRTRNHRQHFPSVRLMRRIAELGAYRLEHKQLIGELAAEILGVKRALHDIRDELHNIAQGPPWS